MCICNPDKCCNGNCRAQTLEPVFDKDALQQSVNLMAAAISRVSSLENAVKNAINVIEDMKRAIGKDCYRYPIPFTWHSFALEEQAKLKKVLDQGK